MAQNKMFEYSPLISTGALLPLAVFNVGNSLAGSIGIISSQPYAILKHIRLTNVLTSVAVVVGLYK